MFFNPFKNIIKPPAPVPKPPAPVPKPPAPVPKPPAPVPKQPASVPKPPAPVPKQPASVPKQPAPVPKQPAPVPKQPAPVPKQPAPVPKKPAPVPKQPAPVPKQPAPVPRPQTIIPNLSTRPPPSPKPLAPPAKPKIVSQPPKPMITNINTKPIIMPISGSPVSSRNTSPTNIGLVNKTNPNKPSIKSTFQDTSKKLTDKEKILLQEIKKLQDIVNVNIKNINDTTNETNVVLSEIKQLETEVNENINIPDNIGRANKISDRLEKLEKSIKKRVKSNTIIELLTNRINFILGNLHKKVIEIKDSDKGVLELLPNVIANIILFIINLTIYIIPILIIGFLIIYVIFSKSEYAIAIKEKIQNLFNFSKPVSTE